MIKLVLIAAAIAAAGAVIKGLKPDVDRYRKIREM